MFTVAQKQTPRKVFRVTLRDEAGVLARVDGEILFFTDDGQIIEVEPEDCVWLCVFRGDGTGRDPGHHGPLERRRGLAGHPPGAGGGVDGTP